MSKFGPKRETVLIMDWASRTEVTPVCVSIRPVRQSMSNRGRLQKYIWWYISLWENNPTSHFMYYFSKHFLNEFMSQSLVSILLQHSMMFISYIIFSFGWKYMLKQDKLCGVTTLRLTRLSISTLLSLLLHKMALVVMPNSRLRNSLKSNGWRHSGFTLGPDTHWSVVSVNLQDWFIMNSVLNRVLLVHPKCFPPF